MTNNQKEVWEYFAAHCMWAFNYTGEVITYQIWVQFIQSDNHANRSKYQKENIFKDSHMWVWLELTSIAPVTAALECNRLFELQRLESAWFWQESDISEEANDSFTFLF